MSATVLEAAPELPGAQFREEGTRDLGQAFVSRSGGESPVSVLGTPQNDAWARFLWVKGAVCRLRALRRKGNAERSETAV